MPLLRRPGRYFVAGWLRSTPDVFTQISRSHTGQYPLPYGARTILIPPLRLNSKPSSREPAQRMSYSPASLRRAERLTRLMSLTSPDSPELGHGSQ